MALTPAPTDISQIITMGSVTNASPSTGQVYFTGTHLYMNIGGTTYQIDQQSQMVSYLQESGSPIPTLAAGTGAGTSPTKSLTGGISGGTISLTTGTLPSASAVIVTVTYGIAFPTDSSVIISPANLNAAQLSGSGSVWINAGTTTFTLNSSSTGLVGSTAYAWNYVAIGW